MKSILFSIIICLSFFTSSAQNQPSNYNKWDYFFKEFKDAIIKDNESKLLLLSNKTLADMPAKEWIKSAKGGSEFSTLQNNISSAKVQSEGPNKKTIDFADTNNCYLEFRITKSGWKLFNVVYYAD
jgi:hypothetical protein